MSRKASKAATPVNTRRSEHVKREQGEVLEKNDSCALGVRNARPSKDHSHPRRSGTASGNAEKVPSRLTPLFPHRHGAPTIRSSNNKSVHNGNRPLTSNSDSQRVISRLGQPQHIRSDQRLSPSLQLLKSQSPMSSIWSYQTDVTGTSSSSNKTVTQASYRQARDPMKSEIDVFRFLVHEATQEGKPLAHDNWRDEDESSWDSDSDSGSSNGSCAISCCGARPDGDTHSVNSSGHCDSGVSMSDDSPVLARRRPTPISEFTQVDETSGRDNITACQSLEKENTCDEDIPVPGGFPTAGIKPAETPPPAPSPPPAYQYPTQSARIRVSHKAQRLKAHGYDLVAREYCSEESDTVPPVYRRFELLQHRTLMHLQDQICELEAELKVLDNQVGAWTTGEHGHHQPQSRRLDRVHPNIGSRRHHILDCLSYCLSQYSQLLASHQTLVNGYETPSDDELDAIKTWFRKHQPIPANETGFLQHGSDLLLLKKHSKHYTRDWSAFARGGFAGFVLCILSLIICKII